MTDPIRDKEPRQDRWTYGLAHAVLIYLVALLLTLPLFIIIYPHVPELTLPFGAHARVDHLLLFVVLLAIFIILVRRFQLLVYTLLLVGMLAITITGLFGRYGFQDLYRDYAVFLHSLHDTTVNVPIAARATKPFQDSEALRSAIDLREQGVRNFAVRAATAHFSDVPHDGDEFTMIQCFSIFKEINTKWKYVADPTDGEYFAKASETIEHLSGDCDDHAILMAACIKAVGGEVRLVRTTAHIYPELLVGDEKELERAAYLIRKIMFKSEVRDEPLFYHTDPDGRHWLNLDYTRRFPGGQIMDEKIIGILRV